jgi:hypothetical protein
MIETSRGRLSRQRQLSRPPPEADDALWANRCRVIVPGWWALLRTPAFGIFVVVVGSNQYGVTGTALRIGMWMLALTIAATATITLRRNLPAIMRPPPLTRGPHPPAPERHPPSRSPLLL